MHRKYTVIELCYFDEQMYLDNTEGTDMRVSTRRKTHKQKQLNYDQVNLFVSVPCFQLNAKQVGVILMLLTCIQEVFGSSLHLLQAIPLPVYKIGCKSGIG
jgi:maltodextrin utilization protein YvdJ